MLNAHLSIRKKSIIGVTLLVLLLVGGALLWIKPAIFFDREDDTWLAMHERGVVRVGLDPSFPPFDALDESGAPVGYDVDLAAALAQRWGLRVELVALGFDSLIDAVMAAKVDAVISAMPFDERLTEDVRFSPPYFESGIRLAVRQGSPIGGVEQLTGRRVAVEWGSAGDMIGRLLQRQQQIDLTLVPFDTPQAAIDAASDDTSIDALLVDQVSLRLAQGQGADLIAVGPVLESNPYVIVSPGRAFQLAEEIRAALDSFQSDGALIALENKWFGTMQQTTQQQESP